MFGKLMDGINDDYLRYVFHVQVLTEENAAEPDLAQANYVAADDPVLGDAAVSAAYAAATPAEIEAATAVASGIGGSTAGHTFDDGETQAPIVKSDREKIGRNEPCWCGSGKKYKLCHGAN
jgi:preprotein translocase subunit SecA